MRHSAIDVSQGLGPAAIHATISALAEPGAIVLRSFPLSLGERELLNFARSLGELSQRGVSDPHNKWVHRVADRRIPMVDAAGHVILSTTARRFELHTDESFCSNPADIVIQLCAEPAECGGGLTELAFLSDVLKILPVSVVTELVHSEHPSARLIPNLHNFRCPYTIRYNPHELHAAELTTSQNQAVEALRAAITRVAYRIELRSGDCLVLDNTTVLHGRTSFRSPSKRLLYRARVHSRRRTQPRHTA